MPDASPFLGGPVRILATSPALNIQPRDEQTALRHLMNRRANATALALHNLGRAGDYRRFVLKDDARPISGQTIRYRMTWTARGAFLREVADRIQAARTVRLCSAMGARLP